MYPAGYFADLTNGDGDGDRIVHVCFVVTGNHTMLLEGGYDEC